MAVFPGGCDLAWAPEEGRSVPNVTNVLSRLSKMKFDGRKGS